MKDVAYASVIKKVTLGSLFDPQGARGTSLGPLQELILGQIPQRSSGRVAKGDLLLKCMNVPVMVIQSMEI